MSHEYVACQARKAHLTFTKDSNCFTHITNAARLAKIADTLAEKRAIGRLTQVCEQWIYSTCLCIAPDSDEQERTGFHYSYSQRPVPVPDVGPNFLLPGLGEASR